MYAGRVYADFQNLDDENRVRLTAAGTVRDLSTRSALELGTLLPLYTDDANDQGTSDPLLATGTVERGDDGALVARVDWGAVRNASSEIAVLQKRYFDTAIGDMLRALDGGALIGATTLGLCVLDQLGFLRTCQGTATDFAGVVTDYLQPINKQYEAKWLWEVRNRLVHGHGVVRKPPPENDHGTPSAMFTHLHPERHLSETDTRRWLNAESFVADVIAVAWATFDDFRLAPEKPLQAYPHLSTVWHSDSQANKSYGDMHPWLSRLDPVPFQRHWLEEDIRRGLAERTPRKIA